MYINTNQSNTTREIEIPFDFSTTCSAYTHTPPFCSSTSPIPSISNLSTTLHNSISIQPYNTWEEINLKNLFNMGDYEQPHNEGRQEERDLAQVLESLRTTLQRMNINN